MEGLRSSGIRYLNGSNELTIRVTLNNVPQQRTPHAGRTYSINGDLLHRSFEMAWVGPTRVAVG